MGIRAALGAPQRALVWMIIRDGLYLTASGLACGLFGLWFCRGIIARLLFRVGPLDPGKLLLANTVVLCVVLLAALVPARRVAFLDPMISLRHE